MTDIVDRLQAELAEAGIGEHGGDTCGRREAKYRGLVELVDEQREDIGRVRADLAEAKRQLLGWVNTCDEVFGAFAGEPGWRSKETRAFLDEHKE